MKVTLIYPGVSDDPSGLSEPLGLLYVASILRDAGHEIEFIDLTFNKEKTLEPGRLKGVDLIGVSSTTVLFPRLCKFIQEVNKEYPGLKSFLGGSHVTLYPETAIEEGFTFGLIGEGEGAILPLIDAIKNNKGFENIDGLVYAQDGKTIINERKSFVPDLDTIPFPARDLWDYEKYFETGSTELGMIGTRGCPYRCIYCKPMIDKIFGNKIRSRSPRNIAQEMEELEKKYSYLFKGKPVKIWFKDDMLTLCTTEWFKELRDEVVKRGLKAQWGCHSRVDSVDYEKLKIMKEAGLTHISYGVESGSQKILNYYRKGAKVESAIQAFDACHDLGIRTFAYFMIGAPIETKDDLQATYDLIKRIRPDGLDVFTTIPYPGNHLYEKVKAENLLKDSTHEYYEGHSTMELKYLKSEDLVRYRRKMYRWNNVRLASRYFSSVSEFSKLIKYLIKRPGFVINYLKRSL